MNPAAGDLLSALHLQSGQMVSSHLSQFVANALQAKEPQHAEYTLGACHYLITISPVVEEQYANLYWTDITGRKGAELELHASRDKLQRALEFDEAVMTNMGEGLYTVNNEGLVTSMNPAAEALFGWTCAELLGRKMHEMTHYKHVDGTPFPAERCPWLQVLGGGSVLRDQEDVFIRKDGTFFNVVYSSSPLRAQGQIVGLVVVFRNVTDRKRAEDAVRASEARLARELEDTKLLQAISSQLVQEENSEALYEEILDAAVGIMRGDFASMHMLSFEGSHAGALRLLGFRGLNSEAAKFWEWVRPASKSTCGMALRTGQRCIVVDVEKCDFMSGTADQACCLQAGIHAVQSTPLMSRAGKLVGMISTHWRKPHIPDERELRLMDVLARQAADLLERKRAEETIRVRAEQFETLVNQAPLGIYLVDADFRIAQVNPTARQVFGDMPDLIGRDFEEVIHTLWHKAYADEIVAIFRHTLNTGEPYMTPERIEPRLDWGGTEYYEWRVDRIVLPDGRFGVVCYFRDISALVEAREALRQLNDGLEHIVRERTEELMQSHRQLRALAAELNLTEQRERKRLATELHDHLQQLLVLGKIQLGQLKRISQSSSACIRMITETDKVLDEALSYTRTLISELSPPVLRNHGLLAGLRWLEEYMRTYHLNVTVQLSHEEIQVADDQALLLFQSVRELLINCAKYAETSEAWVEAHIDIQHLVIEVMDKGKGFVHEADVPSNISPEPSSKFGLFSIRERMHALGGSFQIFSSPGNGTIAVLRLPLSVAEASLQATKQADASHELSLPLPF
jgi:PAS domain S-box-containing protein